MENYKIIAVLYYEPIWTHALVRTRMSSNVQVFAWASPGLELVLGFQSLRSQYRETVKQKIITIIDHTRTTKSQEMN